MYTFQQEKKKKTKHTKNHGWPNRKYVNMGNTPETDPKEVKVFELLDKEF